MSKHEQIKGQAYSKAAKREQRRARTAQMEAAAAKAGVPALVAGKRKQPNGRTHRSQASRDPQTEMLKARCRRWGLPSSKWREMRDPWWGCEAGGAMAMAVSSLGDRKALWDAICWMRRTVVNFDRTIGAPDRHAQCLRLLLPISEMSADSTSPAPDDRTDEQKQDDAVRALQCLEEWIGRAGPEAAAECRRSVLDDQRPRNVVGMVAALAHISSFIDPKALTRES